MSSSSAKPSSSLAVPIKVREMSAEEAAQAKPSPASSVNVDAIIKVLPPSTPSSTGAEPYVNREEAAKPSSANPVNLDGIEVLPRSSPSSTTSDETKEWPTYAKWKVFSYTVDAEDLLVAVLVSMAVFFICLVVYVTDLTKQKPRALNYFVLYATFMGTPIVYAILAFVLTCTFYKLKKYRRFLQRVPRAFRYTPRRQSDPMPLPPTGTPTSVDTGKTNGTTLSVLTPSGTTPAAKG